VSCGLTFIRNLASIQFPSTILILQSGQHAVSPFISEHLQAGILPHLDCEVKVDHGPRRRKSALVLMSRLIKLLQVPGFGAFERDLGGGYLNSPRMVNYDIYVIHILKKNDNTIHTL